ncbi:FAD:protein FMN transferase [Accumulibacter sp.]|uniref:FAD:protein FMN transferase n=1 Tax=Accumulibacter sp. TaxID=2053492 RepID=UPI00258287FF|nr:FAD:protein FMN transferase [Accumulibacter sp.]MCC2867214.1 FAD:protein FMN transferase [Candidatus Accumulibacter phosphatis]MCM8581091.1 FAD:protein FMN transferase [Accumulibacter sp.]HMW54575.1 FAD:protein FMN transferase [Accumulibacter sp.]HNC19772.1 FAD:protein FMN transferase [Accumulibacter sp.]
MTVSLLVRLLGLLLASVLMACERAPLHHQEAFVFGTRVEVLIAGLDETAARPAAAAVLREFDRLHRTYHAWKPSELSTLNEAIMAGRRQPVTPEMVGLITDAQYLTRLGERLFDPGIGRLISLWGFQSDELPATLPDPFALAAWRAAQPSILDLRIEGTFVSSDKREVALDFGGYLKGVALDRAAAILHAQGVHNALINIGGNVMALGSKNGQRWRVGIQHPRQPGPLATIELANGEAIGTSGDYQRFFEIDGHRYCHLLDPRSAQPALHTQSLSVLISPRTAAGTLSDMASKPLFIAGSDWPRLARALQVEQVLRVDAQGQVQVSSSLHGRLEYVGGRPRKLEVIP